jgi:hypothetical protein
MSVFSYNAGEWADVLGIQFRMNFLLPHISEFYEKQPSHFNLVKMEQKMDTCCEELYACPGTIPAHIHLSSYNKVKEGNEKK